MRSAALTAVILTTALVFPVRSEEAEHSGQDLFTTQVRPILARHCFKCHGPDDKARKAKLRLDVAGAGAKAGRLRERSPIVPGKPDESELVSRIFADDASERMPRRDQEPALRVGQAGSQAAGLPTVRSTRLTGHSSPPRREHPPHGPRHELGPEPDRFVHPGPARSGGTEALAEPADRATLIRRLSLDLIGLPPTPEEVEAFLEDDSPDAYEKVVDRLLASPHYGERWARRWLDLARYADTNGYEKDRIRSIWPYRDWVIQCPQRRHAVRPVHRRAARRRHAARRDRQPADRHGLPPQHDAQRRRGHRPARIPLLRHDRSRRHHRRPSGWA